MEGKTVWTAKTDGCKWGGLLSKPMRKLSSAKDTEIVICSKAVVKL